MNHQLPPLPLIDGCLFIDNSGWVEGFSSCYRYLQYKVLNARISASENVAANWGSSLHLALELRHSLYDIEPVDDAYWNDVSTVFAEFFKAHPVPFEDWRDLNWSMTVLKQYIQRRGLEDFSLLKYDEPINCPHCEGVGRTQDERGSFEYVCLWCRGSGKRSFMVELPFALPLYTAKLPSLDFKASELVSEVGIPVFFCGKIDLPISLDGRLWVMDHKTTGLLGDMFWNEQRMTSQHRGYAWAFEQLTGHKVHGYIVNAIRSKMPPQYVTNGTVFKGKRQSPEDWWNESFQRERFLLKPNELEEWKFNTIDLVEEFFWHYSRGYMPMKTKWCPQYGRCPYYDVCSLASEDRQFFLSSGAYTDNKWSPLKQPTQAKA